MVQLTHDFRVTLALVKEELISTDLKNHASADLVETALLDNRLVRYPLRPSHCNYCPT